MEIDTNAILEQAQYWVNTLAPLVTYLVAGVFGFIKVVQYVKSIGKTVTDNSTATDEKITETTEQLKEAQRQMISLSQDNANLRKEVKRLCNKIDKIGD